MSTMNILDLEKPIAELDANIAELKRLSEEEGVDRSVEIADLEANRDRLIKEIFSNLSPWDETMLARHPSRPYTLDYVRGVFEDFIPMHGDRLYADDKAMVGGMASLNGTTVMLVGQQKGRDLKDRQFRNFGSARPEGYRKALRLMKLAEKLGHPIITFVDTPAADCSMGSEERGISEAIARNMREMALLRVPVLAVVIGEGGSGGAIGIGLANRVFMMEHAVYSVIPPESCAAIIWRDPKKGPEAAACLKLTATHAKEFGIADEVIAEPLGGAHRKPDAAVRAVKDALIRGLSPLLTMTADELVADRYEKFRRMGVFECPAPVAGVEETSAE